MTGTQTVPNTGNWQVYSTVTIANVNIVSAGVKTMKFNVDIAGYNFNYITFDKHQSPFGGTARAIPGIIQAEDFDDGGPEVAYHDNDVPNDGAQYRTSEQVDIEVAFRDTGFAGDGQQVEHQIGRSRGRGAGDGGIAQALRRDEAARIAAGSQCFDQDPAGLVSCLSLGRMGRGHVVQAHR